MTMLQSLVRAYDSLAARGEVAPFGYSPEKIAYVIALEPDGSVRAVPTMRGTIVKGKHVPAVMQVPQGNKRTVGIDPNFLWDKTSYVLGATAGLEKLTDGEREKRQKRVAAEHQAFASLHLKLLADADDPALVAFRAFITHWKPEQFSELGWPVEMLDQNVAFAFGFSEGAYLHERPAARDLWASLAQSNTQKPVACLITGQSAPAARLHPSIKGVPGAQSSGASIVSFNKDSFTSYGHDQGDNAPVSAAAAFAYGTALNHLLRRAPNGSWPNRVSLGDTVAVFWAEAPNADTATLAETSFGGMANGFEIDAQSEATKVGDILQAVADGRPIASVAPELQDGVTFNILGLAPNAARLSVRFWLQDSFGTIADRFSAFCQDIAIDPPDAQPGPIPLWKLVRETAVLGKGENVSPLLAGEWFRSVLTGGRYPQSLLASILTRIRADGNINARRAAILKAILIRNYQSKEAPVAFDPDNTNRGYLLGRLFATYVKIQEDALGSSLNSSIKDKYYGAASAQPRKVFRLLDAGSTSHLSRIGRDNPKYRTGHEKRVGAIMAMMSPGGDPFPTSLSAQEQALFGLGYHHQRGEFFRAKSTTETPDDGE
jgi:CRISPR-associated protein Csd1